VAGPATDRYIWPLVPKERIAAEGPMVLVEGKGSRVKDTAGNEYLDLSSGITRASSLGYGNEEIVDAVSDQLRKLHYAGTAEYQADVVFELAEKLAELTPGELGPSYFTESGTAANEAAFKLARFFQQATGKPRAHKVISRWNAYHGAIGTPMAVSDWLGVRLPADPGVPGVSFVPGPTNYRGPSGVGEPPGTSHYLEALEQQIVHEGPELVAAIIAEPVMQANGVQVPPADYFPGVRELCDRYDIVFIADEVICGFGRTGRWFGIEHWGVQPDMITMAKALTAGYMPLGAAIVKQEIWDALESFPDVHTFGGHAGAGAAAMTAIEIYEREGLIERAREVGEQMLGLLRPLDEHEIVGEVRGLGMWACVDFTSDPETRAPMPFDDVRRIVIRAREQGLVVTQNGGAIELAPRLDVPLEELEEGVEILDRSILGPVGSGSAASKAATGTSG
jgi:adenosylmethionine-8-amino-7-oxononanoate aminotransferase